MKGRTKWYPRHIVPVRHGAYECFVRVAGGLHTVWPEPLQYDGKGFLVPLPMGVIKWRGLTKAAHNATQAERERGE